MTDEPSIRILPDYHCFPTWVRPSDDPVFAPVPAAEVTATRWLQQSLERWAQVFDSILDLDDPASAGFATPREERLFVEWGRSLAQHVADEHGQPVLYFDILRGADIRIDPR